MLRKSARPRSFGVGCNVPWRTDHLNITADTGARLHEHIASIDPSRLTSGASIPEAPPCRSSEEEMSSTDVDANDSTDLTGESEVSRLIDEMSIAHRVRRYQAG